MISLLVLGVSALLQVIAAVLSFRLIRVTGHLTAWILLSSVMLLQALRRILSLLLVSSGQEKTGHLDGLFGLIISAGMLAVVLLIKGYFETMAKREERFRTVADFTYDWETWEGTEGALLYCSPSCERITGHTAEAFMAEPDLLERLIHPEDLLRWKEHRATVHKPAKRPAEEAAPVREIEFRILRPDRGVRWIGHVCHPIHDAEGHPNGQRISNRDITEHKLAEQALHLSEDRYRRITEGLTDYQYTVRVEQGRAVETRHGLGCETVTGYTAEDFAIDPYLWFMMILPEDREAARAYVEQILAGQEIAPFEHRILRKDGALRWVIDTSILSKDSSGRLLAYDGVVEDITERKQAEEEKVRLLDQLHQSQKMESLGILAGGVAHDMNNVLGAVLGLASANLASLPEGTPLHRAFTTITKACIRGRDLVRSLLSFARQGLAEEKELDLNALIRDEVRLLERTTLSRVRLEMDLATDLRPILGDASALTHVLMNLCVNAVDAMPEKGTLTLRTRNADHDWVEVVVADTGGGMSKEVLAKAMDPFFTTKEQGKGTGLGLSIAHSTVLAHHGQMEIRSEPSQGTLVFLRFPACASRAEATAPAPARETASTRSLQVLLVDDDELIQNSLQSILEMLGHTTTIVSSGEEALAKLEAGFQPDVVLLDMNMPGLGGSGTLPRLRALRPSVPVLLCTGRADQSALDLVSAHQQVQLLTKPFSLQELQNHLDSIGLE